jgi:arylsulfatase A-like enzyme
MSGPRDDIELGPFISTGLLYGEWRQVIVKDDWKYIRWTNVDFEELYDLAADPGEKVNLAQRRPRILSLLREDLRRHHAAAEAKRAEFGIDPSSDVELDQATLNSLKALGYIN